MMRRYNRLLVAFFVISDSLLGMAAFLVAYLLRFESGLPVFKGYPPFANYLRLAPFIGLLVPLAFQMQGLYRLRRGRSRVDDFFGVFVGSILTVVLGLIVRGEVTASHPIAAEMTAARLQEIMARPIEWVLPPDSAKDALKFRMESRSHSAVSRFSPNGFLTNLSDV